MNLDRLVFVTSNLDKLREAEAVLGIQLAHRALDLDEIQSLSLEAVVRHKAESARARIEGPVLVEDTALELEGMDGFPGPLIRWLLASVGPDGICKLADAFAERNAVVRCMACAADGSDELIGLGVVEGRIATRPRGDRGFGWDSIFIPSGGEGKTYAEMETLEKNRISHRRLALEDLRSALG
ncbi:MAG: non-canonical purine NTP pyrophosphatase [Acidobacteria bacterium]|nr:non-canonical purine NTP pyrophosphatase [Acidobacteriota bacterium]